MIPQYVVEKFREHLLPIASVNYYIVARNSPKKGYEYITETWVVDDCVLGNSNVWAHVTNVRKMKAAWNLLYYEYVKNFLKSETRRVFYESLPTCDTCTGKCAFLSKRRSKNQKWLFSISEIRKCTKVTKSLWTYHKNWNEYAHESSSQSQL